MILPLVAPLFANAMKDVLILAGTGLRGRPFTDSLLGSFNLTLVQRGTPLWDVHENLLNTTRDDVNVGECDRQTPLSQCEVVRKRTDKEKWDICIDFWPNNEKQMDQTLDALNTKCNHYIYVSSHFVYTASGDAAKDDLGYTEDEARFPDVSRLSVDKMTTLEEKYSRGQDYLKAEMYLRENAEMGWTIVRPAEVFGPKESEVKLWLLSVWAKAHRDINIPIPWVESELNTKFSMLSNIELAHGLQLIVKKVLGDCCINDVRGEVFNLAHEEWLTQQALHASLVACHKQLGVLQAPVKNNASIYPSHATFVSINMEKAKRQLNWNPRSTVHSLMDAVGFYEKVMYSERYAVQRVFFMGIVSILEAGKFGSKLEAWADKHYQIDVEHPKHDIKAVEFDDEDEDGGELEARKFTKSKKDTCCEKYVADKGKTGGKKTSGAKSGKKDATQKSKTSDTKKESTSDATKGNTEKDVTKKSKTSDAKEGSTSDATKVDTKKDVTKKSKTSDAKEESTSDATKGDTKKDVAKKSKTSDAKKESTSDATKGDTKKDVTKKSKTSDAKKESTSDATKDDAEKDVTKKSKTSDATKKESTSDATKDDAEKDVTKDSTASSEEMVEKSQATASQKGSEL